MFSRIWRTFASQSLYASVDRYIMLPQTPKLYSNDGLFKAFSRQGFLDVSAAAVTFNISTGILFSVQTEFAIRRFCERHKCHANVCPCISRCSRHIIVYVQAQCSLCTDSL